jgi:hypothetical protein
LNRAAARISEQERAWKRLAAQASRTLEAASSLPAPRKSPPAARFDQLYEAQRRDLGAALRMATSNALPPTGLRRRRALARARARLADLQHHLLNVEQRVEAADRDAATSRARAEAAVRAGADEAAREALLEARAHERLAKVLSCEVAEGRAASRELEAILAGVEHPAPPGEVR